MGRAAVTSIATACSGRHWRADISRALIEVQGLAQRAKRDRQALPRRLDAPSATRTAVQGRAGRRQRRVELHTWVDWFDTFGLGRNVPIATGNMNDSLLALADGKFVNLRVPYPIGFFTKWVEGRIDDANAGWKGRSLWTTYSTRTMFHLEGGKENRPNVDSSCGPIWLALSGAASDALIRNPAQWCPSTRDSQRKHSGASAPGP